MPRVLSIKNYSSENLGVSLGRRKQPKIIGRVFEMNCRANMRLMPTHRQGSIKFGLAGFGLMLLALLLLCGAFYLYQVNDMATKGYELRDLERQIDGLKKDNAEFKIREVELKSMYNIEKATDNLDLVNSADISFLEINGPVAMK